MIFHTYDFLQYNTITTFILTHIRKSFTTPLHRKLSIGTFIHRNYGSPHTFNILPLIAYIITLFDYSRFYSNIPYLFFALSLF